MENDPLLEKPARQGVAWRCMNGKGAGRKHRDATYHAGCGKINPMWTTVDPWTGGSREKRWLGRCTYCPKVTSLNMEAGNIVRHGIPTRKETIEFCILRNHKEGDSREQIVGNFHAGQELPPDLNITGAKWADIPENPPEDAVGPSEAPVVSSHPYGEEEPPYEGEEDASSPTEGWM